MSRTRSLLQLEERVGELEKWREEKEKESEESGDEDDDCPDCGAESVLGCTCEPSEEEKQRIGWEEEEGSSEEECLCLLY